MLFSRSDALLSSTLAEMRLMYLGPVLFLDVGNRTGTMGIGGLGAMPSRLTRVGIVSNLAQSKEETSRFSK